MLDNITFRPFRIKRSAFYVSLKLSSLSLPLMYTNPNIFFYDSLTCAGSVLLRGILRSTTPPGLVVGDAAPLLQQPSGLDSGTSSQTGEILLCLGPEIRKLITVYGLLGSLHTKMERWGGGTPYCYSKELTYTKNS